MVNIIRQDFSGINRREFPRPVQGAGRNAERPHAGKGNGQTSLPQSTTQRHVGKGSGTGKNTPAFFDDTRENKVATVEEEAAPDANAVIEELRRIHAKMDGSVNLVARMDKLCVTHNRQQESMAKLQDALTSLREDVQHLHKVNGGAFAGKMEVVEGKVATLEDSIADVSRSLIQSTIESERLVETVRGDLNDRLETAQIDSDKKNNYITTALIEIQNASMSESPEVKANGDDLNTIYKELAGVKASMGIIQELAQDAFHRSLSFEVRLVKDVSCVNEKFVPISDVKENSVVSVRYPMVKNGDDVYMRNYSVKDGTVTSKLVPLQLGSTRTATFI